MKYVNAPVMKKDAMALVTGKPVYMDDVAPKDCLIVKVLRSPHAHALIEEINITNALKQKGIECILTYKDVPHRRFTMAGQTFPEPSPYDRYILDQRVRFVGDAVAIVAGEDEAAVDRALKLIKVKYQVLEPVLDYHTAKDNPVLVHPEEDWKALCPVGADNKRNLCASGMDSDGDVDGVMKDCDIVMEGTYHVKAMQQSMMETFRTATYLDTYGRINILSSTQIPFHVRRILANALDIPKSKVRVIKPRIGGGFGAKQTVVAEVYPAIVTMKTGKPAKIIYTREESLIASSPRHEMEVTVKLGAMKDGTIRALDLYTLSNTGAFGEHGPTTVGLSGHKSIPMYQTEAFRFQYDVVYTNHMSAGAYRGYGATQGIFAVESMVNRLADKLGMDPLEIRYKNMTHEGDVMPAYYGETANSCKLEDCLRKAADMIGWEKKPLRQVMPDGKIRGLGTAMAMQGSAISNCDVGSVTIKLSDEGFYNVIVGCTDMGTGCDTIIAQFVADSLDTDIDNIAVFGVDTDTSPYDSGSYASSTTYLTGMAAVKAAEQMREKLLQLAAKLGVSRTPIREAIRMLEQEGLAVTIPRKGAEVAKMTEKDMEDVLQIREALDELAAKIACEQISEEQLEELVATMHEFEESTKTNNVKKIAEADVKFHDIIYQSTGNPKLVNMLNNLREQMYRYRVEYLKDENNYPTLMKEHKDIVEGLVRKNKTQVTETMHQHVKNQAVAVKAMIQEQE